MSLADQFSMANKTKTPETNSSKENSADIWTWMVRIASVGVIAGIVIQGVWFYPKVSEVERDLSKLMGKPMIKIGQSFDEVIDDLQALNDKIAEVERIAIPKGKRGSASGSVNLKTSEGLSYELNTLINDIRNAKVEPQKKDDEQNRYAASEGAMNKADPNLDPPPGIRDDVLQISYHDIKIAAYSVLLGAVLGALLVWLYFRASRKEETKVEASTSYEEDKQLSLISKSG